MTDEANKEPGLLDLPIDELREKLAGLTAEDLGALLEAEKGGKTRKGAIEAIETALAALAKEEPGLPPAPPPVEPDVNDAAVEPLPESFLRIDDLVIAVSAGDFLPSGQRRIYNRPIVIGPDGPPRLITAVALCEQDADPIICEIPPGLRGGGGATAEIPAGHLIF